MSSSSPSLADSIRALRETASSKPTLPPSRPDPRGSRRTAVPSPLQQSTQDSIAPASDGEPQSSSAPHQPSYSQEPSRTPQDRLGVLLATGDSSVPQKLTDKTGSYTTKPSSYAPLRNVSAPIISSAGLSPPSSPTAMMPPSKPSRPDPRPIAPRNASIDSAISSISSNSQSYRSTPSQSYTTSAGATAAEPPDIRTLVLAAGSPEAALNALWKEKQSASAHNAQLWRLVEKQRTMILGLNKDLERALKEKERYRKKLHEHMSQVPPLPRATQRPEPPVGRESSQSPALSELQDDMSIRSSSAQGTRPENLKQAAELPDRNSPVAQSPQEAESQPPSTSSSLLEIHPAAVYVAPKGGQIEGVPPKESEGRQGSSPKQIFSSATGDAQERVGNSSSRFESNVSSSMELINSLKPKPTPSSQIVTTHLKTPSLSLTEATPIVGSGTIPSPVARSSQASRKPPPAPLDLSQPNTTSAHLHQSTAADRSDSDYDDILEVDEIPLFERGRRKTREDDDRAREVLVQKEEEHRSRSKKKSKSKSKSKPPSDSAPASEAKGESEDSSLPTQTQPQGLPSSPRLAQAPGSIASMLNRPNADGASAAQKTTISAPLLSPGLPMSPRPADRPLNSPLPRMPKQNLASPPLSPRPIHASVPLTPRAPKQPIPLPPNTPLSAASPHLARAEAYQQQQLQTSSLAEMLAPTQRPSTSSNAPGSSTTESLGSEQIYEGLISEQYPGLLLPPNALPSIDVKVFSSRLQPSRPSLVPSKQNEDDPVFILAIHARSDGRQLWRVAKTALSLPQLDHQVRSLCGFSGRLPDKGLFTGHAPSKIDARRAALTNYFDLMLDTPMSEKAALVVCKFFSTDVIGAQPDESPVTDNSSLRSASTAVQSVHKKEGYLSKRGKFYGGWKARYFVLEGAELKYYDDAGGPQIGIIKLRDAQIGRQMPDNTNQHPDDADNEVRHGFIVLEAKKKDPSSRFKHLLCAESDEERDAWISALLEHIDDEAQRTNPNGEQPSEPGAPRSPTQHLAPPDTASYKSKESTELDRTGLQVQGVRYDDVVAAEAPVLGPTAPRANGAPSPPLHGSSGSEPTSSSHPIISGPTNGAVIQNAELWGNKTSSTTSIKDKKRSIFGFGGRGRSSSDIVPGSVQISTPSKAPTIEINQHRHVFGIPLAEAVECSAIPGVEPRLPAVVYRSLEYLRARKAKNEEGIFRINGSTNVLKNLQHRFNHEGDVRLLDESPIDVHAVAGLLKQYVRDLPAPALTPNQAAQLEFARIHELHTKTEKITFLNLWVHKLPEVNFDLLQAIFSYLVECANNHEVNKMNVRNLGICWVPCVGISATVMPFFLSDYAEIFGDPVDEAASPIREVKVDQSLAPDSIRSPRRQMFSDLPTPAYNQTTFHAPGGFAAQNVHHESSPYDTGFIPLQPTYDTPIYQHQQQMHDGNFGSLNGALQPSQLKDTKQKRRESGMLLMNFGLGQKRSMQRMREDKDMVKEESAFN